MRRQAAKCSIRTFGLPEGCGPQKTQVECGQAFSLHGLVLKNFLQIGLGSSIEEKQTNRNS